MIGYVSRAKNRNHDPEYMFFQNPGEEIAKYTNLCSACEKFRPGREDNCSINQRLHQLQVETQIGGPIVRCSQFQITPGREKVVRF